jgi:phosphatidylserine decarboxylase
MGMRLQNNRYDTGDSHTVNLQRGEEMGVFNMGSTVILLFGTDRVNWVNELQPGTPVRLGQLLGNIITRE